MAPRCRRDVGLFYRYFLPVFLSQSLLMIRVTVRCREPQFCKLDGLSSSNLFRLISHFTSISTNVICCITFTLCNKIYIGETGKRLADRFCEHLRENKTKQNKKQKNRYASKPAACHFNLSSHSHHNMTICRLSLHHGKKESRKILEQKFIFQLGTLSPHGISERLSFH